MALTVRRRERGDILLVTLIFLLVTLLAVLTSLRSAAVDNLLSGNNLMRQKNVHVADIALRILEGQVDTAAAGVPLETSAVGQPWYRDVAAGTAAPDATYWSACLGHASATLRCASITPTFNGRALPYTAYAVVQPTGRYDTTACTLGSPGQYTAGYYAVFLHVQEANGATAVDTETIYRLCTPTH